MNSILKRAAAFVTAFTMLSVIAMPVMADVTSENEEVRSQKISIYVKGMTGDVGTAEVVDGKMTVPLGSAFFSSYIFEKVTTNEGDKIPYSIDENNIKIYIGDIETSTVRIIFAASFLNGWYKYAREGNWYYYTDGVAAKGWLKDSDTWYYMDPEDGFMLTDWQKISGTWYYLKRNGAMVTGWQKINNKWYFFKSSGAMAANEWCGGYWLNKDGSWTYQPKGSWKKNSKGWWFGDTSGWYAKNTTVKIDNVNYKFDASGYWVK